MFLWMFLSSTSRLSIVQCLEQWSTVHHHFYSVYSRSITQHIPKSTCQSAQLQLLFFKCLYCLSAAENVIHDLANSGAVVDRGLGHPILHVERHQLLCRVPKQSRVGGQPQMDADATSKNYPLNIDHMVLCELISWYNSHSRNWPY